MAYGALWRRAMTHGPDLFAAADTQRQATALAALDAWLAATDRNHGTIGPNDPGYWPPPVAIRHAFPPKPEQVNRRSGTTPPQKSRARGFRRVRKPL